ncbi:hypothetical protein ACFP2F_22990 [Hymenobacter artigasi]|uniref:DUF4136 domain-containing protein n=1 Tax=Hymenobacter artigasi TaxID=2719616 RepID=A0ABX1HP66_9BACT|nr:hypothetical protein [Hymenobacter artigasi]NKI92059.1 hypothetical protein [Hymenobacter artigasi]
MKTTLKIHSKNWLMLIAIGWTMVTSCTKNKGDELLPMPGSTTYSTAYQVSEASAKRVAEHIALKSYENTTI